MDFQTHLLSTVSIVLLKMIYLNIKAKFQSPASDSLSSTLASTREQDAPSITTCEERSRSQKLFLLFTSPATAQKRLPVGSHLFSKRRKRAELGCWCIFAEARLTGELKEPEDSEDALISHSAPL